MADGQSSGGAQRGRRGSGNRRAAAQAKDDSHETQRMVLRGLPAILVPHGVSNDVLKKVQGLLRDPAVLAAVVEQGEGNADDVGLFVPLAFTVEGEPQTGSKDRCIEAVAGKAGTPDARPGTYRAPSMSAMRGGKRYTRPPRPKVEAETLD